MRGRGVVVAKHADKVAIGEALSSAGFAACYTTYINLPPHDLVTDDALNVALFEFGRTPAGYGAVFTYRAEVAKYKANVLAEVRLVFPCATEEQVLPDTDRDAPPQSGILPTPKGASQ